MSKRKIGILLLLTAACMFNTYGGSKKSKKNKVKAGKKKPGKLRREKRPGKLKPGKKNSVKLDNGFIPI